VRGATQAAPEPDLDVLTIAQVVTRDRTQRVATRREPPRSVSTYRFRGEALLGAIAALATAACYSIGSSRAFDYDGSVTVVLFIRAPISAAIRGQYVFNNHPYFSLLEQFVWRITGSSSESTLRLLPVACAAGAVGIVGFVVSRRWGILAGGSAAAIVATNPVFIQESREVRGYSLMVLCAVVSSCILWSRERLPWHRSVYVAAMGLGLGTHLFMFVVLAIHVVVVASSHRMSRSWECRWAVATAIGSVPYLFELRELLGRPHPRMFNPNFPLIAARDLLGHQWLTVAITGCLVALALWRYRHSLALAAERKLRTVAFPAISCGAFGYPAAQAAEIAVRECAQFLAGDKTVERVSFALFSAELLQLYERQLSSLAER